MSTIISLLLLLVFLAGGFFVARFGLLRFTPIAGIAFSLALYLLLFSMGLRLGQSRDVLANLSLVGALAISCTLFACAGTVLLHVLFIPVYRRLDRVGIRGDVKADDGAVPVSGAESGSAGSTLSLTGSRRLSLLFYNLRKPFLLLVLVVLGTAVGYLLPEIAVIRDGSISTVFLYILLFIIGLQMADSGHDLARFFTRPSLLVVPLVTIVGTLAGSLGTLAFDGMTPGRSFALASGFGWYSLSGVLIANLGDPMLGAASFLSNLLRETLAFLAVPLLRLTGRPESGIGVAGATSMDVTLPVIGDAWGPSSIPLSVAHGVILSLLVPFLVPLFMSL